MMEQISLPNYMAWPQVVWKHQVEEFAPCTYGYPTELLGVGRCDNAEEGWPGLCTQRSCQTRLTRFLFELNVLLSLRTLWGCFVPKLFLHKPLATMPLIGLQLGNLILEDEMSLRNKEDTEKAHQAIDAVRAVAQEQCAGGIRDGSGIDRIAKFDFFKD